MEPVKKDTKDKDSQVSSTWIAQLGVVWQLHAASMLPSESKVLMVGVGFEGLHAWSNYLLRMWDRNPKKGLPQFTDHKWMPGVHLEES